MFNENNYLQKMSKTFEVFTKELSSLRTGRANSNMLDIIKVDVYGSLMPLNQVGSINVIDQGKMIVISPWDKSALKEIDNKHIEFVQKIKDLGLALQSQHKRNEEEFNYIFAND